jgi:hypothetical protein
MRMSVITDQDGNVVGTAGLSEGGSGSGKGGPVAGPGQTVHVVDAPDGLDELDDADDLHARVRGLVS